MQTLVKENDFYRLLKSENDVNRLWFIVEKSTGKIVSFKRIDLFYCTNEEMTTFFDNFTYISRLFSEGDVSDQTLVDYRHKDDTTGDRFVQLAKDPLPSWAADVKIVEGEVP